MSNATINRVEPHKHSMTQEKAESRIVPANQVTGTILLVEDSRPERTRLVAMLSKLGYTVIEAENGCRALEIINTETITLVLSDWHMPIMNGLELCIQCKSLTRLQPYFILLTGRDAPCDLVAAMDAGADDYLTKPFNSEELRVRLQAGFRLIEKRLQIQQQNREIADLLTKEKANSKEIQNNLIAAQRLQLKILPKRNQVFNGVQCAQFFQQSEGMSGDLFSVIPLGSHHIAFYHFNMIGTGVRAAMLAFTIANFLLQHSRAPSTNSAAVKMQDPANVLQALNSEFQCDENSGDCLTITYGVIDSFTGAGKLAQAGHTLPIIVDPQGNFTRLGTRSVPIGMFSNIVYKNHSFVLPVDAKLVLYSDSVLDLQLTKKCPNKKPLDRILGGLCSQQLEQLQNHLDTDFSTLVKNANLSENVTLLFLQRVNQQSFS